MKQQVYGKYPLLQDTLDYLAGFPLLEADEQQEIITWGDKEPHIGFLKEGLLIARALSNTMDGNQVAVSLFPRNIWFGLEAYYGDWNLCYTSLVPCRYWKIPLHQIEKVISPDILSSLVYSASDHIGRLISKAIAHRLSPAKRVISIMFDIREECSFPELPISQADLASLSGLHRNKIGKVLKELEEMGIIERRHKEIVMPEKDILKDALGIDD